MEECYRWTWNCWGRTNRPVVIYILMCLTVTHTCSTYRCVRDVCTCGSAQVTRTMQFALAPARLITHRLHSAFTVLRLRLQATTPNRAGKLFSGSRPAETVRQFSALETEQPRLCVKPVRAPYIVITAPSQSSQISPAFMFGCLSAFHK